MLGINRTQIALSLGYFWQFLRKLKKSCSGSINIISKRVSINLMMGIFIFKLLNCKSFDFKIWNLYIRWLLVKIFLKNTRFEKNTAFNEFFIVFTRFPLKHIWSPHLILLCKVNHRSCSNYTSKISENRNTQFLTSTCDLKIVKNSTVLCILSQVIFRFVPFTIIIN